MKKKNPQISIILLNYNGEKYIKKCLESIDKQTFTDFEIIISDNASKDKSLLIAKQAFSGLTIINNVNNLGYARANNNASLLAKGEYLFFLNIDTRLEKNCLLNLIEAARKESGIFTAKQMSYDGKNFISCGIGADIFGYPYSLKENILSSDQRLFYADGAALFIKKSLFEKLNRFDPTTFLFHEDIDLSWKAKLLGFKIVPVPEAIVFHESGGILEGGAIKGGKVVTNPLRRYLGERNNIRNLLKNYAWQTLVWILPLYFLINCAEILLFTIFLRPKAVWCYLKAWLWNIVYFSDTMRYRKRIQKVRKVADFSIQKDMYHGSAKLAIFRRVGVPKFK